MCCWAEAHDRNIELKPVFMSLCTVSRSDVFPWDSPVFSVKENLIENYSYKKS